MHDIRMTTQRLVILVVVAALHAGLLLLVILGGPTAIPVTDVTPPLVLLLIPPETAPRVRAPIRLPAHLHTDMLQFQAPPVADSPAVPGASTGANSRESGVDWSAEAHRAVRAYEIRREEAPTQALSVTAPGDEWPTRGRRTGVPSRMPNGDWIVWIDANCYQIATGKPRSVADEVPPETKCLHEEPPPQ
jgi:hypothetical protein